MRSTTWLALTTIAIAGPAALVVTGCGSRVSDHRGDAASGGSASTGQTTTVGTGSGGTGGSGTSVGGSGGSSSTSSGPAPTEIATCQGKVYQCGDLQDNDGDGLIDSQDPDCLGPCDNSEEVYSTDFHHAWETGICKQDCYFDQDSGAGNDGCYWNLKCDEVFDPEGSACAHDPGTSIAGFQGSCADAYTAQSDACLDFCGPLTPNGCDCFGCCVLPGAATPVWLGPTKDWQFTCSLKTAADPSQCAPCTQVPACLNACAECELCLGKTTLPPGCDADAQCPGGEPRCGLAGQDPCAKGYSCITGCCQPVPT